MKVNTLAIIRQFIGENKVQMEVKTGYIQDRKTWDILFNQFLLNGWKYSNVRKTYIKTYYNNDYTSDRFNEDLDLVKESFIYYKYMVYKNISVESNFKG